VSLGRSNVSIECEETLTGSSKLQLKSVLNLAKHADDFQDLGSKDRRAGMTCFPRGKKADLEERARRSNVPEEACWVVHSSSDMSKGSMTPFNGRFGGDDLG
jgi:hypothetical protein